MSNEAAILSVVAVLYLLECIARLPTESEAYSASFRQRWRPAATVWQTESHGFRLVTAFPFLPWNRIVVCDAWPVQASPEEFWIAGPEAAPWRLDGQRKIEARGPRLFCDGTVVARLCSGRYARRLAAFLRAVQSAPPAGRAALIEREMRARLDAAAASKIHGQFLRSAGVLSWLAEALFLLLFAVAPFWMALLGLNVVWPALLALVVAGTWTAAILFYRLHRQFLPEDGEARWGSVAGMFLSPAAAARACAAVERDLLSEFHVLAVAKGLEAEDLPARAGDALRRLHFPVAGEGAGNGPAWFAQRWSVVLEDYVRRTLGGGFSPLAPPSREAGSVSYCPRCHSQYVVARESCAQCPDLAVQPFDSA
jgi:hypothetical protein